MIKSASFIMQSVLVILAILVFSFFDPFGIFGSKKQTLVDTPITVSSIKEIGKFISAEYYGEVLSSLNEIYIDKLQDNVNDMKSLDSSFCDAMSELASTDTISKRKNKLLDYFHDHYTDITENPLYNTYIEYLKKKYNTNKEKNLIDKFVNKSKPIEKFDESILKELNREDRDLFTANKKTLKQQIVLLGRGWVKAGFNFEKFTTENFKYISSTKTIYLLGIKPEILSCTINPWFIPEKNVKGFQLVVYTGKANDPAMINRVKEDCLRKLKQTAMDQNILRKAEENAKLNLKAFFSLLIDGGINDVVFVQDTLEAYRNEILRDSIVNSDELSIVDSILSNSAKPGFDSLKVMAFIDSIKSVKYILMDEPTVLTGYSSFVNKVVSDQAVDSMEMAELKRMKNDLGNPYKNEVFWMDGIITDKEETRKKWFNLAIDNISRCTNQVILSPAKPTVLKRNGNTAERNDSQAISELFLSLKN